MALPTLPKRSPKSRQINIRISDNGIRNLKKLTSHHNLTQSDVIEYLMQDAVAKLEESKPAAAKQR